MKPAHFILAQQWELVQEQMNRLIAHELERLEQYAASEGANDKAVEVRERNLDTMTRYVEVSDDIINAQGDLLREMGEMDRKHEALQERYAKLAVAAKYKGIDIEALEWVKKRDIVDYILNR
jgi:hypothetical protein